jgi:hypothetical protein
MFHRRRSHSDNSLENESAPNSLESWDAQANSPLRTAHNQPTFRYVLELGERLGRATWRHCYLPKEIPGNLAKADGGNKNYHGKN